MFAGWVAAVERPGFLSFSLENMIVIVKKKDTLGLHFEDAGQLTSWPRIHSRTCGRAAAGHRLPDEIRAGRLMIGRFGKAHGLKVEIARKAPTVRI